MAELYGFSLQTLPSRRLCYFYQHNSADQILISAKLSAKQAGMSGTTDKTKNVGPNTQPY